MIALERSEIEYIILTALFVTFSQGPVIGDKRARGLAPLGHLLLHPRTLHPLRLEIHKVHLVVAAVAVVTVSIMFAMPAPVVRVSRAVQ